ncbi:MAG TPA: trypsin-like peptidase domain-containing protein [Planctomycetota bacterium]|jgi:serine protease Do
MRYAAALALVLGALPARAQDPLAEEMAKAIRAVRDSAGKSVVAIEVIRGEDPEGETGSGPAGAHKDYYNRPAGPVTGTILSADGFILTTAFNVSGEVKRITVTTPDGRRHEAKRLGADRKLDIALLKIDAKDLPLLPRAKPGEARVGDFVCVIGRGPDPAALTVNQGILSALGRRSGTAVQTDAEVNYGNVGGPLVTMTGEWIGITAHIYPRAMWGQSSGVAFASKNAEIDKVLEDLKKGKDIAKPVQGPWIGVLAGEPRAGVEGVPVDQILPNSPAEEAGLDAGDVIAAVDGKPVKSVEELKAALAKKKIGDEIELTIRRLKRDGKTWEEKKVKIKLAENPN